MVLTTKPHTWRKLAVFFLSGMVMVNGLILWYGRSFASEGYADFAAFYTAGKLVRLGQGSRLRDQSAEWQVQQEFASKVTIRHKALPYVRPAFEALLFWPFARFPYRIAYVIWVFFNASLLLVFPFLLKMPAHPLTSSRLLQGVLCFSCVPAAIAFLHGQDAILLLLIVTMVFLSLKRQADFQAGLWLSLGLIKFHLIIPLALIFIARGKSRIAAGFACGGMGLAAISLAIIGWHNFAAYPAYLWRLNATHNAGMSSPESMPNIRGLLTIVWGVTSFPHFVNWLLAAFILAAIGFVANRWKGKEDDGRGTLEAGFSVAIITILLTSYYAYSYDLTLLILPFFLLGGIFAERQDLRGWPRTVFFGSAIIFCSPLPWLIFFGFGHFYLMVVLLILMLAASMKALKILWSKDMPDLQGPLQAGGR